MTMTSRRPGQMRRSEAAARRAAASGSGPVLGETHARYPGAQSRFGLLGEVLTVGILVTAASLPLVTVPAALAAGTAHLRRFLRAEEASLAMSFADFRRALAGGVVVGLATIALTLVLLLDIDLASSGALPGGPMIGLVGWLGLAAVGLALFTAAGLWSPETGWRGALQALPAAVRSDPAGAGYTIVTGVFAVVVTWQLAPLVVPALGCVVLAIVAIPERPRRGDREA